MPRPKRDMQTVTLYLTSKQLERIDELALTTGEGDYTRSGIIRRLIDDALKLKRWR